MSAKFENIHAKVIALIQEILYEYDLYIRESQKYINKRKSTKSNVKTKLPKKPDFYERKSETMNKLLLELYSLQGVLMLYGYKKMSSVIYAYTSNLMAISPRNQKEGAQDDIPEPEGVQKFIDLRMEFYEAANYYLSNQASR